ncbi:MAG: hypothetical protein KKB89_04295 [Candidatus Omnitrophica bacterium]|nr:hypothetical protein [Candidatus Omnitrophota bacterium]
MKFEFKPSFDKSIKSLPKKDKTAIKELCKSFIDVLESKTSLSPGLGLERLRKDFWEIRKGLKLRVVFRWQNDYIEFILAGSHSDIKNFLKNV